MLTGALSIPALSAAFRSLSHKKRQGVLEITFDDALVQLSFFEGKIVEVTKVDDSELMPICERLVVSNRLNPKLLERLRGNDITVKQLHKYLTDKNQLSHEEFIAAKSAVELDVLHSLVQVNGGYFNFKPKLVKVDKELALSLHPGQLVLDFLEIEHDDERFYSLFGAFESDSQLRVVAGANSAGLSAHEERIWRAVEAPQTLVELRAKTLLSTFALKQSLLVMYDRESIEVLGEGTTFVPKADATPATTTDRRQLSEAVEEEAPVPAIERVELANSAVTSAMLPEEGEEELPGRDLVSQAARLLQSIDETSFDDGEFSTDELLKDLVGELEALDLDAVSTESPAATVGLPAIATTALERYEIEAELRKDEEGESDLRSAEEVRGSFFRKLREASPRDALRELNILLLDAEHREYAAVFSLLIFLLALALVAPTWFETWFQALSSFSSLN